MASVSSDLHSGLSRETIKYLAVAAMFLNHFANALLSAQTLIYEVFVDIGYFTAITMCYFLVEGYYYTHSRKKYAQRLLIFGVISQIPYMMALGIFQMNMMFTLLICLGILCVLDQMEPGAGKILALTGLVFLSVFFDWALLAPVFTILFFLCRGNRVLTAWAFAGAAVLFGMFSVMSYLVSMSLDGALIHGICSCLGLIISGIVILYLYNGKSASKGGKFSKWFFYWFYPVHLLLLWIVKLLIV